MIQCGASPEHLSATSTSLTLGIRSTQPPPTLTGSTPSVRRLRLFLFTQVLALLICLAGCGRHEAENRAARAAELESELKSIEQSTEETALLSRELQGFLQLASSGDTDAMLAAACIYRKLPYSNGGLFQSGVLTVQAAMLGNLTAMAQAADIYAGGMGYLYDEAGAARWLEKSADSGGAQSARKLGFRYAQGDGVSKDLVLAVHWYRVAIGLGDAYARLLLAKLFSDGAGNELEAQIQAEHIVKSLATLQRSAEAGDVEARFQIGQVYYYGYGVHSEPQKAVAYFLDAANAGHVIAQYNLGVCYAKGHGVTKDFAAARKWWMKSALQGYARAQFNLGAMYSNADGIASDLENAFRWWHSAAAQGLPGAETSVALAYLHGTGVKPDAKLAAKWFLLAARKGSVDAQFNLAKLLATGEGVPRDDQAAYHWYNRAGVELESARIARDDLAREMSRPEIVSAQGFTRVNAPGMEY